MTIAPVLEHDRVLAGARGPDGLPLSICLVSHNAYGAISGGRDGHVGGVEWQTSLTALWLASRGHRVTMLTWDEGQGREAASDGVRVLSVGRRDAGVPGVRFFHPRWTGLRRALGTADADVYYHNCGEYVTGQVALWCRGHGRAFVYSVASNPDCDPRLPAMRTLRERVLYRYGLKHADEVVVQTRAQQQMLAAGFGRSSTLIPMPCPGPHNEQYVEPAPPRSRAARVAWVGRIVPLKRLEWLLEIAGQMPDVAFDVVGDSEADTPHTRALKARAAALANVTLHGRVPRDHVPQIYRQASCLCCTSTFEGFPNTFLEAFSHGVPVVSTVDPDGLIAKHGLGAVAESVPDLTAAVRDLLASETRWRAASTRARQYYCAHHTPETVLPQFEAVFRRAAARVVRSRAEAP